MRRILLISTAAIGLAACSQKPAATDAAKNDASAAEAAASAQPAEAKAVNLAAAPTGAYVTEAGHRYITFSYWHQGLAKPWLRWRDWSGDLSWNAEDPTKSSISVTINTASIDTGVDAFDAHMKEADLFDVAKFPVATFKSTRIERTGPNTGKITGDLTIKDVTKPITLDARINDALFAPDRGNPSMGKYKLGFSATAKMLRSDWNMGYAVPFVGDEVDIVIEAEFESPQPIAAPAQ